MKTDAKVAPGSRAEGENAAPIGPATIDVECPRGDTGFVPRLIGAASDLGLLIDAEGVVRSVSVAEGLDNHGPWRSLIGQRWRDTVRPDSRGKLDELLEDARSRGQSRAREVNQRLAGVPDVPLRFSGVLLDATERTVIALGRDLRAVAALQQSMLTAQQSMDREYERLRQGETRYRLLFHLTSECVLIADATSRKIVEANPAAVTLLGDSAQRLQGSLVEEHIEPASWPRAQAMIDQVLAGTRPSEVRVRLSRPEVHEVSLSASMFRQSGAVLLLLQLRPTGIPEVLAGSTGAARASRLLAAIDALPDGFVVVDQEARVSCANTSFCEMVQLPHENQITGQPLERWLGRPGVDLDILLRNLREHGSVRNFSTIVRGEYGSHQEAAVSAVSALDGKVPCYGFSIRAVPARLTLVRSAVPAARSEEQLRELVGRLSLKEIIRESTDLIERLCIEAALKVSGDNRASAAQLLGLSRQGLYSKLHRYGFQDLDPAD